MAIFHFNIIDGVRSPDQDGVDLRDIGEARVQAVRLAGDLLRYSAEDFLRDGQWRLEVTDDRGRLLFTIHLTTVDAHSAPS